LANWGCALPPEANAQDDLFLSLMAWTERGKAPERVIATKFEAADPKRIAFQRPLCAYPRQGVDGPFLLAHLVHCHRNPRSKGKRRRTKVDQNSVA
jgi:hypothetical protein